MAEFELGRGEAAGFDLAGWRQADGRIRICGANGERIIPEWPESVALMGTTYTLENVEDCGPSGPTGEHWEDAVYC